MTSAKARLRGLQRQEKKEEQKSNGTFWAFQAMNDTLHDILEPKLQPWYMGPEFIDQDLAYQLMETYPEEFNARVKEDQDARKQYLKE